MGEAGMPKVDKYECDSIVDDLSCRTISPTKRRGRRGKHAKNEGGMKDTMIEIVNLIKNTTTTKEPSLTPSSVSTTKSGCSMTLDELNGTHDRYMAHLQCLKDNDLLTPERKQNILKDMEDIIFQISNKHGLKRGIDDVNTNSNSNNANNSVS